MSKLTYGVYTTDITKTTVQRQAVLAGNGTYQGTDWVIASEGVFNPAANAWVLQGVGQDPVSLKGANVTPTLTDAAVREYLLQPRRLLVFENGLELLRSPTQGYPCDVANGPTPLRVDVTQIHGTNTFRVYFVVRTRIVEASLFTSQPSVLLSNSWSQNCVTDQDHYSRLTTKGRATFRRDILESRGLKPDDYRGWMIGPPCPTNFQRCQVNVEVAENGYEANWMTLDIEKPYNLMAYGITRIEASRSVTVGTGGFEETIYSAIGIVGGKGIEKMFDVVDFAKTLAPGMNEQIVVRVWGNRNATKDNLRSVCRQVALIFVNFGSVVVATTSATISEDLVGTFCEFRSIIKRGPVTSLSKMFSEVGTPDGIGAPEELAGVTTKAEFANPVLPNHSNTRGTYLGQLVASSLATPYQVPPRPPAPAQAGNFAPP